MKTEKVTGLVFLLLILITGIPFCQDKIYTQNKVSKIEVNKKGITNLYISAPKGSIQLIGSPEKLVVNAVFECTGPSTEFVKSNIDKSSFDIKKKDNTLEIFALLPENLMGYNQVPRSNLKQMEQLATTLSKKEESLGTVQVNFWVTIPPEIKTIHLINNYGNIDISNLDADIFVESKHGEVNLENIKGTLDIKHSYGDVRVTSITGDVFLNNSHGTVFIKKANNVNVNNSFNDVHLENIRGEIVVENSNGKVFVSKTHLDKQSPNNQQIRIKNRSGDIVIKSKTKPSMKLNARTKKGAVSCDFPVEATSDEEDKLEGTVGGGDNVVDLENSDADILIESEEE